MKNLEIKLLEFIFPKDVAANNTFNDDGRRLSNKLELSAPLVRSSHCCYGNARHRYVKIILMVHCPEFL